MSENPLPENLRHISPNHSHTKSEIPSTPSDTFEMNKPTPMKNFHLNAKIIEALQNLTPKRDIKTCLADNVSPKRSCKSKRNLDLFSTCMDEAERSNRPSISIYSEASTKGGTISSLSRLTVKTIQSPKSLLGLPLESQVQTATNLQASKTLEKSLIEIDNKLSRRASHSKTKVNPFMTNREETFEDLLGIKQETTKLIDQKHGRKKSSGSQVIEDISLQYKYASVKLDSRGNEQEPTEQKQLNNSEIVKRSKKGNTVFNRANRIKKAQKEGSQAGQSGNEGSGNMRIGESSKIGGSCMLLEEKSPRFKFLSEKGSATPNSRTLRNNGKIHSKESKSGLCLQILSENEQTISGQLLNQLIRKEIEEIKANSVSKKATSREALRGESDKKVEYEKLGRKGMMMKRLRSRNQDGKQEETDCTTVNQDKEDGSKCLEKNNEASKEETNHKGKEAEISHEELRRSKRPKLRRMKSELQRNQALLNTGEDQSVKTTRLLEDVTEDKQEQDSEFLLFKKGSNNFFEVNQENKFVQKYDLTCTVQENITTYKRNTSSEKTPIKNKETNDQQGLKSTSQERKRDRSSQGIKTSSSEKCLDPSTMIVKYYDEMQPMAIQPKFMEATGSMCFTELWSNKKKQDFYKKMRKPFQSNIMLSLNPQPGLYRPERPINSEILRYRRIRSQKMMENIEVENTAMSPTSYFTDSSRLMQQSRTSRHTRAFVLQGGSSTDWSKKSTRTTNYYSPSNL